MRRTAAGVIVLLLFGPVDSVPALAGDRFFMGIGGGPFHSRGSAFFAHHHRSRTHFFFQFGHHPYGLIPWAPGRWGYDYSPPVGVPYPLVPEQRHERGFSGADASGALYVDGYRVLPSGWLRLQVEPADATVLIDGFPTAVDRSRGTSQSLGLPVGSHMVEAYKPGFHTYQSEVEVKQGREIFLRVNMDREVNKK